MTDPVHTVPWYAAGLSFSCSGCGGCCAGPGEGYVWVTADEIAAIAAHLGVSEKQMRRAHVRSVRGRLSLRERRDNRDCVFLAGGGNGGRTCAIYPVRPTQCRTWPFWPSNLGSPDAWARAGVRCPGINRGARFTLQQIQARRNATEV